MSEPGPRTTRWAASALLERLRWLVGFLVFLELIALVMAGQANFSIGGDNPPWVGHRWHPIVVGATAALVLSVAAFFTSARRRGWARTTVVLCLSATVILDAASVMWHHRAFGTRRYFEQSFADLHLASNASPTGETYLAGPGGYETPDDPRGTRSWRVDAPVPTACSAAAHAAARWSTDGVVRDFDDTPKPTGLGCHFDVNYQRFNVTFQDIADAADGTWTLEAFMDPS